MQAKPELRRSERFSHKSIIKLDDDLTLSPYYAVSHNLSENGMYFKSLFELYPGAHIIVKIDEYTLSQNKVPAKVVWCKKLEDAGPFHYGVGVEFLQFENISDLKTSLAITPQIMMLKKNEGGVVIRMEKR